MIPIRKDPNDERPIRPQKNPQFTTTDLDVIPEKPRQKSHQKNFLKKKKVYDPKESIKKEQEHKRKAKTDQKPNRKEDKSKEEVKVFSKGTKPRQRVATGNYSPSKKSKGSPTLQQIGKSKTEKYKTTDLRSNKFADMDQEQRVQKISQLLRGKRP